MIQNSMASCVASDILEFEHRGDFMHCSQIAVTTCIALGIVQSGYAGLTVSSFKTTASTNAFAPLDRSAYFDEHVSENTSPAIVTGAGDWIGTNVGGSANTWHWVGSAHIETSTDFGNDHLVITGLGSFIWDITTTDNFFSPNQVAILYGPGAGAGYTCEFTLDAPASYTLGVQLNRFGTVRLSSVLDGQTIFSKVNVNNSPAFVNIGGPLPAGKYSISSGASLFGLNFVQGAYHEIESGSFTNFSFSVQVPEPCGLMVSFIAIPLLQRQRHWR